MITKTITTETIVDDSDVKEMRRIVIDEFKFEWKQLIYWKTTKTDDRDIIGIQYIHFHKINTLIDIIWKMLKIDWTPMLNGLHRYMNGDLQK